MSAGRLALGTPGRRPALDPAAGEVDASRALGVYVHVPFCSVRCPYCDFAVDTRPAIPHTAYADALVAELEARAPWFARDGDPAAAGRNLRSIYFGGGTPSLLEPAAAARVIAAVSRLFGRAPDELEVTLEANPGEVDLGRLGEFRAAGFNRLSFGAQSFDDRELAALGRNHRAAAVAPALVAARAVGFSNITCDLIFGTPGQTLGDWRRSLEALLVLEPEHLSAYALTVEPGTKFANLERRGQLHRPDEGAVAEMFALGRDVLFSAGYEAYEISSFARPGFRAVHNQLYWTQGAYLGVGVSAASFRPLGDGTGLRFSNPRSTETYLQRALSGPVWPAKVERRGAVDLENEAVWLALRTADGVDRHQHRRRFGADVLGPLERQVNAERCKNRGWLVVDDHQVRLSDAGLLFADEVATMLWCSAKGKSRKNRGDSAVPVGAGPSAEGGQGAKAGWSPPEPVGGG